MGSNTPWPDTTPGNAAPAGPTAEMDGRAVLDELYDRSPDPIPKRPHQSKLFATGMGIVMLGALQITLGEDYTTGIATVIGGLLTIVFRRFTDRPFTFTGRGGP